MTNGVEMRNLLFLLLVLSGTAFPDNSSKTDVNSLLERERKASIFEEGATKPFQVTASFTIAGLAHGPLKGTLVRTWVNKHRWRQEVSLAGFRQLTIHGDDRFWRQRNAVAPDPVRRVLELFNGAGVSQSEALSDFDFKGGAEVDGKLARCVEKKDGFFKEDICFDNQSGLVVRRRTHGSKREYSNFQPAAQGSFPWNMTSSMDDQPRIDLVVEQVTTVDPTDSMFVASPTAEEWPVCEGKFDHPDATYQPDPRFPDKARQRHWQGSMLMSITVDENGNVPKAGVTDSIGSEFDKEAIKTVSTWKFKPARCDGKPIKTEATVQINFHLR